MITENGTGTVMTAARQGPVDRDLVELVDALVEAVDVNRWAEVDRLRLALEPFGATELFDAELRLNGIVSETVDCICGGGLL